jgi:HD-GYP domain-containing protein (c-di-GMP phosphodiesterase class II)
MQVRSAELLAALSLATDLGTGYPLEHGLRTCLVAVRLGERAGADDETLRCVYYLALLHSIGCTADAPEAAATYGDDLAPRASYTLIDEGRPPELIGWMWRNVQPAAPLPRRLGAFAGALAKGAQRARTNLRSHCEVGHRLAGRLGMPDAVRDGLAFVFERFDGKGFPEGVAGEAIPLTARLLHAARDADAFHLEGGLEAVVRLGRERAGTALDPSLAALVSAHAGELFGGLDGDGVWREVVASEPATVPLMGERLDTACTGLADFADLKSIYTLGHSRGVAELAEAAAWRLGLGEDEVGSVRRGALLHDLGRVGVSTAIWDKQGTLSGAEWEQVRLHPYLGERALSRAADLSELGRTACEHHERLDGTGYHRGVSARDLSLSSRVIAAADCLDALTSPRPHRSARSLDEAASALGAEASAGRLDGDVVEALLAAVGRREAGVAKPQPAGLSEREVEVLRLLSRGLTNKQMGAQLGISPKTVGHHVQSIYSKIGVSTRAAAALFAVEHDLLRGG